MNENVELKFIARYLFQNWKWVFFTSLFFSVTLFVYSTFSPKYYKSQVVILPPQQQSSMVNVASSLGALSGGGAAAAFGLKNPAEIYVGILKSVSILEVVADNLKLKHVYGFDTEPGMEKVLNKLSKNVDAKIDKSGLVIIEAIDEDPRRSADIANNLVLAFKDKMNKIYANTNMQKRIFLEKQVLRVREDLAKAELNRRNFQQGTGFNQLTEVNKSTELAISQLQSRILELEASLASKKQTYASNNIEVKAMEQQLLSLKNQLNGLLQGGKEDKGIFSRVLIPNKALELVRKERDVKYYEEVLQLVSKQYEMAKIDEAADGTTVQIVSTAKPPEAKFKPSRMFNTLIGFVSGVVLSIFVLLFRRFGIVKIKEFFIE